MILTAGCKRGAGRSKCRWFFKDLRCVDFFSDSVVNGLSTIFLSGHCRRYWLLPINLTLSPSFYKTNSICNIFFLFFFPWPRSVDIQAKTNRFEHSLIKLQTILCSSFHIFYSIWLYIVSDCGLITILTIK